MTHMCRRFGSRVLRTGHQECAGCLCRCRVLCIADDLRSIVRAQTDLCVACFRTRALYLAH